jgi:hypothetical protein
MCVASLSDSVRVSRVITAPKGCDIPMNEVVVRFGVDIGPGKSNASSSNE